MKEKENQNDDLLDAHRAYLKKRRFCKDLELPGFTEREFAILDRYGYWMSALADRKIRAISDAQLSFQAAASFNKKPKPPFETTWVKFLRVKESLEKRQKRELADDKLSESVASNRSNPTPSRLGNLSYGTLAPYEPKHKK